MNFPEKAKRKLFNTIGLVINRLGQNEAADTTKLPKTVTDGMPELLREAAAEGTVLLRNDNVLPLSKSDVVSVFGRVQNDYIFVGYGSGGDVIKPYTVSLMEGLRNIGASLNEELACLYADWCKKNPPDHGFWGHWPHYYEEMPISDDIINKASKSSDCAVVVIGRAAGEDRESTLTKGSYYLTDSEASLISKVSTAFKKTVIILDIGNIIDMKWTKELIKNDCALLVPWQGGMESGNAVAEVIYGIKEPSGRLTDTIAENYSDYPSADNFGNKEYNNYTEDIYVGYRYFETFAKDRVLYPFGFGLSYTTFDISTEKFDGNRDNLTFTCTVKNTGDYKGKETVQIYVEKPCGTLGNPARELIGFAKTKELAQGESETLVIEIPENRIWSYDDSGKTGFAHAYVMEKGEYKFYVGASIRDAQQVCSFSIQNTELKEQLSQAGAPQVAFEKLVAVEESGIRKAAKETVKLREYDLKQIIIDNIKDGVTQTGDKGIKLQDVKDGKATLDEFVAQLSLDELEAISRGDYKMDSPLGAKGNAGAMGGVLQSLRDKGVPPMITTDGPSGIRLLSYCSLIPNGTALASTFNTDLVEKVYTKISEEMKEKGSDILLGPGMNIHRSHLCGRNFEYYSEDPVVTGLIGAAAVKGIQHNGRKACPKHYACNNQEVNRTRNDSCLSERALREIYLKGFEICIKEAKPQTLMTSYNLINGVWGHYNYDLCKRILRDEWGYEGLVMTDWWMRPSKSPEFPKLRDQAYRVRAGVNVLMPGGDRVTNGKPDGTLLKTYGKKDGITLYEMQENAKWVLKLCLKKDN